MSWMCSFLGHDLHQIDSDTTGMYLAFRVEKDYFCSRCFGWFREVCGVDGANTYHEVFKRLSVPSGRVTEEVKINEESPAYERQDWT